MRIRSQHWVLAGLSLLLCAGPSEAYSSTLNQSGPVAPSDEQAQALPANLWERLIDQTILGFGYDFAYTDNLFLEDNNKQEDLLSVLESQLLLAGSEASSTYGVTYEVNAYRYHKASKNAIDHDLSAFFDLDPGGRFQLGLEYKLDANNRLVRLAEETDLFRRSTDFQRQVTHSGGFEFFYEINKLDFWKVKFNIADIDDQTQDDASTDRTEYDLDWSLNHKFSDLIVIGAGYAFEHVTVPGDNTKEFSSHAGLLAFKYELSNQNELEVELTAGRQDFDIGEDRSFFTVDLNWEYTIPITPRLNSKLTLSNDRSSSSRAGTQTLTRQKVSSELRYEITPLWNLENFVTFVRNDSDGGSAAGVSRNYTVTTQFLWQVQRSLQVILGHRYRRSPTEDYTQTEIFLEAEWEF